jgi:hypothetical protein
MTNFTKAFFKASTFCHLVFLLPFSLLYGSPCDLTGDGQINMEDVYRAANQAVGIEACETADLDRNGVCDEVDVEHLINASLGQECPLPRAGDAMDSMVGIEAAGVTTTAALTVSGSSVTSYGAKCDGSTNDKAAIQKALDSVASWTNKTLTFPAGKTCVVSYGVRLTRANGWTIDGQGAKIKAANGMCVDGCGPLLLLHTIDQFTVSNLTLDGNRANRKAASTPTGHNFQILKATNGTFRNVTSVNATTDNARIGALTPSQTSSFSKNLTFIDSKFSNAFRNNVSVIEGWNIRFLGSCSGGFAGSCTCQMTGANGAGPEDGIDWEPNSSSASPAIDNGLVDGCLIADNRGSGHQTHEISGGRNITLRNSIIRNNGGGSGARAGVAVGAKGELVENNWIGKQGGLRFGVVYISGGKKSNTRTTYVKNNLIDGVPPVGWDNGGKRQVIFYGNFTDGTPSFNNNKMTNIGVSATGDWCGGFKSHASTTHTNSVAGTMQKPNPGCP